jgi:hypothetical protein
MKPITRRVVGTIALAALLLPAPAAARRRVRIVGGGVTGHKTYSSPNVLKPEDLRSCLQQEAALNELGELVDAEEVVLQKRAEQIDQMGRSLDSRKARVDVYSKASVDAYNREVDRHRKVVAEYNDGTPPFNARVADFNNRLQGFNANCAGKSYYEDDMQMARTALGIPKTP